GATGASGSTSARRRFEIFQKWSPGATVTVSAVGDGSEPAPPVVTGRRTQDVVSATPTREVNSRPATRPISTTTRTVSRPMARTYAGRPSPGRGLRCRQDDSEAHESSHRHRSNRQARRAGGRQRRGFQEGDRRRHAVRWSGMVHRFQGAQCRRNGGEHRLRGDGGRGPEDGRVRAGCVESCGASSDGAATALGQPALAEATTVVLGVATPDTRLLIGLQGVLEAFLSNRAGHADGDGGLDLLYGRAGGADREEEAGLGVPALGQVSPVGGDLGGEHVRFVGEIVILFTNDPDKDVQRGRRDFHRELYRCPPTV